MKHKFRNILLLLLIAIIAFYVIGFLNPITIRHYDIRSNKILSSIRIVQISDLHNTIYKNNQQDLIDKIKKTNPDIIVLTGDIGDDHEPILGTQLLLDGIKDVAPLYYVIGNHEYWARNTSEILDIIKSYGVEILDEKTVELNINGQKIMLSGINDPDVERYTNRAYDLSFLHNINKNYFNILLAHRPERIKEYTRYNIDLVLSGHAHGGQIAIPFLINGLYAPNQGFFPKYAGGMYNVDNVKMIVSRGLAFNTRLPRFYNRPEIVVIDLIGEFDD